MKATLFELTQIVNGVLIGSGETLVTSATPAHLANSESITFLLDPKLKKILDHSKAVCAVVPKGFSETEGIALIQVDDVNAAFNKIAAFFRPPRENMIEGVSTRAVISDTAKIGEGTSIGAGTYIGDNVQIGKRCVIYPSVCLLDGTQIGDDTVIFPNVSIYENSRVGARCIIHASAVIGSYGFGYDSSDGKHTLSVQYGNVVLGDDVEIGANTTIDRGTYDSTFIGDGTKIDNLVQIGHNCSIGRHNMICAHTGIAGSSVTGDFVVMAGRVGIRDHLKIGDGAVIGAMAGVMLDVPAGARIVGIPATPEKEQMKKQVALAKLPEMRKEFLFLQKEVKHMKDQISLLEAKLQDYDISQRDL